MERADRKISPYSFENPTLDDRKATSKLQELANKRYNPVEEHGMKVNGPFDGGTFAFIYSNGNWTFDLRTENETSTRMKICEFKKNNDPNSEAQSVFYTLVGEKGLDENGKTDFVSWRKFDAVKDTLALTTILGILES